MADAPRSVEDRAARYRALGDERRLAIVDALHHSDQPVGRLGELTGLATNLLAFHLTVLEDAGVILRTVSEGDGRRRYVSLSPDMLPMLGDPPPLGHPVEQVLFLCTANSARSQLAAHLWQARTGTPAMSAGTHPAGQVHPRAVDVGRRHGLDLTAARPVDFDGLSLRPQLMVSVCDRAHEGLPEPGVPLLHWSIPDPVGGDDAAFEGAFRQLADRIDRLARSARPAPAA